MVSVPFNRPPRSSYIPLNQTGNEAAQSIQDFLEHLGRERDKALALATAIKAARLQRLAVQLTPQRT